MKRILFVDDEKNILDGIRRMLHSRRGRWHMEFALTGDAALALCAIASFDVVVSDMRMPGMDGATLLGHIRDRFPDTARLILSGYSEMALATRAGPVAYRVLAKPCVGTELESTIDRVCLLQDTFSTPEIRKVIGAIGELPSLSSTYNELSAAMRDPAASAIEVATILEKDVAMTAKVLQLVNSGFFGLTQTIASLRSAVSYLGMDTLKNLALASDTFRVFIPDPTVPLAFFEEMQRHAHRTAIIAGTLPLEPKVRDIAIMAALLHDIGSLVLASRMPTQFRAALTLVAQQGLTQFEAERAVLGTSHAEIGAYLLGLWGIDPLTVEAVAHHHRPIRATTGSLDSSIAVYLASLLAHHLETCPEDAAFAHLPDFDRETLHELGLFAQLPRFRQSALEALAPRSLGPM